MYHLRRNGASLDWGFPQGFDAARQIGYSRWGRILVSGIQEILIIVLLLALVVFLPRRMGKAGRANKSGNIMQALSGTMRLGVIVSALWLLLCSVYFRPWSGELLGFALIGLCPVILGWGIIWVIDGYKKNQGV
jgi:hypothetical protein